MTTKTEKFLSRLEPSGEEKTFVYQQVLELKSFLLNSGSIAVILEKSQNEKKQSQYSVTFVLVPETLNLKVQSQGDNLFDACISAKNKARKTITQLINHIDQPDRKLQVEHFKKFPYLH